MGEILQFPGGKKEEVKIEKGKAHPMEKEKESNVDLDIDKMAFLMGTISRLRANSPKLFPYLKIEEEMEKVEAASDFELIMKVNNCSQESIMKDPCKYLAINYETSNRGLTEKTRKQI